jgi:leucyl/phenylalanyl-tRNA--protein transferase
MTVLQSPFGVFCPEKYVFPHPSSADEDGLVAVGGDLEPERLLSAYSQGIFPWFIDRGFVFWYSPDPRAVLYPHEFRLSKSLSKSIKKQNFEFAVNKNFSAVIESCAASTNRKHESGSWISEEFKEGYTKLHRIGFAKSFECYREGELVGGFYGVHIGRVFFGESMFFKCPDASKATLWFLCANAEKLNIDIIDCQQETSHLLSLGAKGIPRDEFLGILREKITL